MKWASLLPGAMIGLLGCVVIGSGVLAMVAHPNHTNLARILFGIFILSFGAFFATVAWLAPKYGRKVGRRYYFDNNSPMALIIPIGIVVICLESGVAYWVARFLH
jgi:hypothetical protein